MAAEITSPAPAKLREQITLSAVTTLDLKPPVHAPVEAADLRHAIEETLQKAGYLNSSPTTAPLLLTVALMSVENADMAAMVTSRTRYTLIRRTNGASLFSDVVEASCSKYAFLSWERVQHSTECSVRQNIEGFIQKILVDAGGVTFMLDQRGQRHLRLGQVQSSTCTCFIHADGADTRPRGVSSRRLRQRQFGTGVFNMGFL
jgi:hypothetical protein